MKETMDNFDDAVKDYLIKVIDKETGIAQYTFKKTPRCYAINIKSPNTRSIVTPLVEVSMPPLIKKTNAPSECGIVTPLGTFDSVKDAADAHGIKVSHMRSKIKYKLERQTAGWYWIKL